MDVQVLTHVRADHFFLELWTLYYGNMFGRGNLHIMIDGDDWDTHGLCCTNRVRDSSRESSVVACQHEQTDTPDLQDQELARL